MPQSAPRMLPLTLSDERLFDAGIASPLVTLLVTNYNYARYLRQCLDSVARQSYPYWECLIVDDVSSDDSLEVIEDFLRDCKTAHKFRLLRRERNGGQMEAFRSGLAQASGTFVVLLDADDVLLEDFLAKHLKVHLGKKPVAFTSSNQYQINGQGEVVAAEHLDHQSRGHYRYVPAFTFQKGYWIWATASSMMYRKAVLDLIFPGPETTFRICADYYIAHFAQMIGNSILIPEIHGCYRRHGENNFGTNPVLGSINSVGSMDKHPPHDEFRLAFIRHMLANLDRFLQILGPPGLAALLYRLCSFKELRELIKTQPRIFRGKPGQYLIAYLGYRFKRRLREKRPWSDRLLLIEPPYLTHAPEPGLVERGYWLYNFQKLRERLRS